MREAGGESSFVLKYGEMVVLPSQENSDLQSTYELKFLVVMR